MRSVFRDDIQMRISLRLPISDLRTFSREAQVMQAERLYAQ